MKCEQRTFIFTIVHTYLVSYAAIKMQRINYQSESVLISAQNDVEKQKFQHQVTSRSVEITSRGKHKIASANFDESGEYDDAMREWTVHFLRANHASSCPLELLPNLEIKIGGLKVVT